MSDTTILAAIEALRITVETRLATVESQLAAVDTRLETVETRFATVETRFENVEARLATFDTRLSGTDDVITSLRVAVMDRFDRVETRLTTISDDLTVALASSNKSQAVSRNIREELNYLTDEVTTITRKMRKLEAQVYELTRPPNGI